MSHFLLVLEYLYKIEHGKESLNPPFVCQFYDNHIRLSKNHIFLLNAGLLNLGNQYDMMICIHDGFYMWRALVPDHSLETIKKVLTASATHYEESRYLSNSCSER